MRPEPPSKPYDKDIDRIRALYRIPTGPTRDRTLHIGAGDLPPIIDDRWRARGGVTCGLVVDGPLRSAHDGGARGDLPLVPKEGPLPFADGDFDRIILHGTLDALLAGTKGAARMALGRLFMAEVLRVLAPGGVVAGTFDNSTSPYHLRANLRGGSAAGARVSARSARGILAQFGLGDVKVFSLLPEADAPLRLVDTEGGVARLVFRRELQASRGSLSSIGFLLRWLVVELRLSTSLEKSVFFWGRKAC